MNEHHVIDYVEITVRDVGEAKRFYGAAFGWTFNDYGSDYAGIVGRDREVGGLAAGETRRGGPLVVIYSDDLDTTLGDVRAAGGTIAREPYAFPGGRRFHLVDESGNELAVWAKT